MNHHHHDHAHEHHHSHEPQSFNKAFAFATIFNFLFVIVEALYAVSANSMSLLADAGHNLGDVLGLIMAWGASWLLSKPATQRFSYGFKRSTILAANVNALILFFTSGIIAYESMMKLIQPVTINETVVIVVAFIGIFINGGTALLFMKGQQEDLNIRGAYLHLAYDAAISFGVVIAGVLVKFTGWQWLDPVVGLAIVVAILFGSWALLTQSLNLIMDAVPHTIDQKAVEAYLSKLPGVIEVHDLHIWGLSTKHTALTVHLIMPNQQLDDDEYHKLCDYLKETFRIGHVTIQVESGQGKHPCRLNACG